MVERKQSRRESVLGAAKRFWQALSKFEKKAAFQSPRVSAIWTGDWASVPVSRRRLLGYGAALAATYGAAKYAGTKVKGVGKPEHEVTLGFITHGYGLDTRHVDQLLKIARQLGQPYHGIGVESYGTREDQVEEQVTELQKILKSEAVEKLAKARRELERERRKYEQELREGKPMNPEFEQALHRIDAGPYMEILRAIAHEHGVPILLIEHYTKEEAQKNIAAAQRLLERTEEMLELPTLEQQMQPLEKTMREFAPTLAQRNQRIRQNIPRVLEILRKQDPRLSTKEVRMLYLLGQGHLGTIHIVGTRNKEVQFSFGPTTQLIPNEKVWKRLSINPRAEVSELELARIVLGHQLQPYQQAIIARYGAEENQRLREDIANATIADFREISKKTEGDPLSARGILIYSYFLNKREREAAPKPEHPTKPGPEPFNGTRPYDRKGIIMDIKEINEGREGIPRKKK